jgi:RNA polymerase sigma-70 factor (ECF subfamily)
MAPGEAALKPPRTEARERLQVEAAQRDPRCFGELYEDNFERVYAFVASRVRDREHAQDLTADVFHQALKTLPRFEWRGVPFGAWLMRIAANAVTDHFRRVAKERETPMLDDPPAHRALDAIEPRARLYRMVETLPADQRKVIAMRFAEQKSIREIATELGRSEGAIKQLQFRALHNLKSRMGKANG